MFKNYWLSFLVLGSTAYSQNITEDKILNDKKSYQLSSCLDIKCLQRTKEKIDLYDYVTTFDKKYYVTYIVNIDTQDIKETRKKLKKHFPDMILRNKAPKSKKFFYPQIDEEKLVLKKPAITNKKTIKTNRLGNSSFITDYKTALKYFKNKEFEKAYALLNKLFNIKSDDLNINFYLGRSAYETKRYDQAVSAYERFLFEKPDNNRVKLEMARSFFMTKTYKESKKLLLEVQADPKISKSTLTIVNSYLQLIDQKISKHSLNGILMLGVIYDSNINSKSKHEIFNNVLISNITNTTEDATNWYNQEIALVNHKYKFSEDKDIKQDFLIFNKSSFNSKHDSTKLTLLSYTPALSVKYNEKLTVDYALYTDFLSYGGRDKLKTYALLPKFNYIYDAKNNLSGYIKYQKKYDQQDKTQNSIYTEASTTLSHIYTPKLSLNSNLTLTEERAKLSSTTGIDYTGIKGLLSLNYKYKPTLFFAPSLTYTINKYDDKDTSYLVKKENKQLKFALGSTYIYSPKWIVQSTVDYTTQSSNIDNQEYDKYTFGLNLIRPF